MDTVVLKIKNHRINIEYDKSVWNMRKHVSTKNNFVKVEDKSAIARFDSVFIAKDTAQRFKYYPIVTQKLNKFGKSDIEIQCSIPKLLYGTSLFEVDLSNPDIKNNIYSALLKVVQPLLYPEPTIIDIQNAEIKRIDLAKNIILEGKDIVNDFLNEAKSFSLSNSLDVKSVEYKPNDLDGRSVNFWNTGQAYCLYNKKLEVLSIDEKKITSTISSIQKEILNNPIEILRLERRLQTTSSTGIILGRFIEDIPITLKGFLDYPYNLSKILIKEIVSDFKKNNDNLFTSSPMRSEELLLIRELLDKKSFSQTGRNFMIQTILQEMGNQEGWKFIQSVTSERSARNYRHDLINSNFKIYSKSVNDVFAEIDRQLDEFKAITPSNFDEIINGKH